MEEPGRVQSTVSQSVGQDWSDLACTHAQMALEAVIQSEVSQKEEENIYINAWMWNLENGTDEPVCKTEIESQM